MGSSSLPLPSDKQPLCHCFFSPAPTSFMPAIKAALPAEERILPTQRQLPVSPSDWFMDSPSPPSPCCCRRLPAHKCRMGTGRSSDRGSRIGHRLSGQHGKGSWYELRQPFRSFIPGACVCVSVCVHTHTCMCLHMCLFPLEVVLQLAHLF